MNYGATLSAAWADHLAPRAHDAPTVVSLFAGCGGSSLGYSMAGYRELLAVEWDKGAAEAFARNFPGVPLFQGDISTLDPAVLNLAPGELDVLDGSPPCQGFSMAGLRRPDDPRSGLFREYVRLLSAWTPKVFVMENVTGLVRGKMRLVFVEILAALKAAGPGYRVEARVLDASQLGVPQARRRVVFVGVRADLDTPPALPPPARTVLTVRDAWADLDPSEIGEYPLIDAARHKGAALVRIVQPGTHAGQALVSAGRKPSFYALARLHWGRPSQTIIRTVCGSGGGGLLHPHEDRFIGTRELTRLQSFPDQYDWGAITYKHLHALVGNSVPPLMMRAIATTVRDTLDEVQRRPATVAIAIPPTA